MKFLKKYSWFSFSYWLSNNFYFTERNKFQENRDAEISKMEENNEKTVNPLSESNEKTVNPLSESNGNSSVTDTVTKDEKPMNE